MENVCFLSKYIMGYIRYGDIAKRELLDGKKQGHYMWFIFPQIQGLGFSATSEYYALEDLEQAETFYEHEYLGKNLVEMFKIVNKMKNYNKVLDCFGDVDTLKLRSCATLFYLATGKRVFKKTIKKFFNAKLCEKTEKIVEKLRKN